MDITALPLETQPSNDRPSGRNKSEDKGFFGLLAGSGQPAPEQAPRHALEILGGLAATTTPAQDAATDGGSIDALLAGLANGAAATPAVSGQIGTIASPAGTNGGTEAALAGAQPKESAGALPDPLLSPETNGEGAPGATRYPHGAEAVSNVQSDQAGAGSVAGTTALAALQAAIGEGRNGSGNLPRHQKAQAASNDGTAAQPAERNSGLGEPAAKGNAAAADRLPAAQPTLGAGELPDRRPLQSPTGSDGATINQARTGGFDSLVDSSQPRHPTPPARPAEQLALRIHHAVEAGQDRIQFRLHPAELGRIEVRLDFSDDGPVRAAILVERGEALELLQRDSRLLERALQDAGIKTDQGSLSFDLREQNHGRARAQDAGGEAGTQAQAEEQAASRDELGGAGQRYQRDGLLDITV